MLAGVTVVVAVAVVVVVAAAAAVAAVRARQPPIGWGLWAGAVGAVFPEEALLIAIPWRGCDAAPTGTRKDLITDGRRHGRPYLNTEEWSNDMHRCFILLRRRTLFWQFYYASGYALELAHVLTSFADDPADLGTRNHYFYR